jgi:putative ABC transport system permease protein
LGFALAAALTFGLMPVLARIDMRMSVSPTVAASVFVGSQVLCLGAAFLSFRKVASLDPALVFRG